MSAKIYDAMLVAQKYEDVRTKLMNAHMALSDVMRSLAVEQLTSEERATYYSIIDKLLSIATY
jgi:4-hydroxy-L-threonine phosphate dehydrogenase PdxA